MNNLRDDVKDVIQNCLDQVVGVYIHDDLTYNIADAVFEVLGITEEQQDSNFGGKWVPTNKILR